jgi:protein TonB
MTHLIGVAVGVSFLMVAGVRWLHRLPPATASHSEDQTVQVSLIATPTPASAPAPQSAPQRAAAPQPVQTVSRIEPALAAAKPSAARPTVPHLIDAALPHTVGAPPSAALDASDYQKILFDHLQQYRQHVDGAEGTTQLLLTVRRDGKVLGIWVKSSSGQPILDRAAIETVRRAQPLPPIPAILPDTINLVISVAP